MGLWLSVDADGFEDWYREHYRRVFAAVLVVAGNRVATAEAVDEAFARALERWPRVRAMGSPAGWTFTVARNLVRRAAKRAAKERTVEISMPPVPEIDVALWDLVRSLAKRERELIALRYVAGMTEAEIASTLGIAPGTVARGLHDARAHLHTKLAPEEDSA